MLRSCHLFCALVLPLFVLSACSPKIEYDLIIRNGTIYDGSGATPIVGEVAINADTIAAIGKLNDARGKQEIDAKGMAVAPGFINMLSWATISLIEDGRSQSDIRQGVTLEVFGEGWFEGPLNEKMKQEILENQGDIKYEVTWTSLGEYLDHLTNVGISTNIASFVGRRHRTRRLDAAMGTRRWLQRMGETFARSRDSQARDQRNDHAVG
jgi:N-acyl-D-amino-acid deacylase